MISIRSGSGLGDSLYLQSVARHLVEKGEKVEVCSDWPDVFRFLPVTISSFRRNGITRLAHYSMRRGHAGITQFQDCCLQAGIVEAVDLRLDWTLVDTEWVKRLRFDSRPLIAVQLPRAPMGRKDGFGADVLPDCRTIQRAIDLIGERAFIVQIGSGVPLYRFSGIDLDLANQTTVSDVIDIASLMDGFLGYCSFVIPLAESLIKPALLVWSRRGLKSPQQIVRNITPQKILHRPSSRYVFDDCPEGELAEAVDALLDQAGGARAV